MKIVASELVMAINQDEKMALRSNDSKGLVMKSVKNEPTDRPAKIREGRRDTSALHRERASNM